MRNEVIQSGKGMKIELHPLDESDHTISWISDKRKNMSKKLKSRCCHKTIVSKAIAKFLLQ